MPLSSNSKTWRARLIASGLAAVAVMLIAASCSSAGGGGVGSASPAGTESLQPSPVSSALGSQVAIRSRSVDGNMDGAIAGVLTVVDGCVVIKTSKETITPVFSAGDVTWDGATLTLLLTGRALRVGTQVRLSGGFSSGDGAALPSGCPPKTWAAGPS